MPRFLSAAALAVSIACTACGTGLRLGPTARLNGPTGDFADEYDRGYSVGMAADAQVTAIAVTGEAGYTSFRGGDGPDEEFWEFGLGGRFHLGPAFAGGKVVVVSGSDDDDTSFRPEVGLRLGKLTAFGQYKLTGRQWWSLGASYSIF